MVDKYVPVGKVVRTHGIKGGLKIWPYLEKQDLYLQLQEVRLISGEDQGQNVQVLKAFVQKNHIIYYLDGIDSIEAGETWRGHEIAVPPEKFDKLPLFDYYWHELEGLTVFTAQGQNVGQITDFFQTGANHVLVVMTPRGELLIPAIKSVITQVDLEGKRVIIDPLEGLLD